MRRLAFSLLALVTTACDLTLSPTPFPETTWVISERTFTTPHASVRETMVLHPTIHDPVIERRYVVLRGADALEIGGYADEARDGIDTPPFERDGVLVITSGAHVAVIEDITGDLDAARVTWRSPYDAACFVSERPGVNGHYDLVVEDVVIEGARWRVRWVPRAGRVVGGDAITTTSVDGGRSLQCER
jgi:hypothetical protein